MSQENAIQLISAYIDGELGPEEGREVELRIRDDAEWAEIHDRLYQTNHTVGDFFRESGASLPDDGKNDAVEKIVRASQASISSSMAERMRAPSRRLGRNLVAGLLVLLAAAVIWLVARGMGESAGPVAEDLSRKLELTFFEAVVARHGGPGSSSKEYRVWLSPIGGLHLFINEDDGEWHIATTGEEVFEWRTSSATAHVVEWGSNDRVRLAQEVLSAWNSFRVAARDPRDARLDSASGSGDVWTLRLSEGAEFVEVRLEKGLPTSVTVSGWRFSKVEPQSLTNADFHPEGSGVPLQDGEQDR